MIAPVPAIDENKEMLRVTIFAPRALPVIDPRETSPFGGLETSAWLTARGLAQRADCRVSFIVDHPTRGDSFICEGVRVRVRRCFLKHLRHSLEGRVAVKPNFPWLRIHRWEPTLLWKIPLLAMVRPFRSGAANLITPAPARNVHFQDVMLAFGVNSESAETLSAAGQQGMRTVLSLRSNADLSAEFAKDQDYRNAYGVTGAIAQFVIRHSDMILAQTEQQSLWLRDRFQRDSTVIGNPFDLSDWDRRLELGAPPEFALRMQPYALWVGRADRAHKRPLEFLRAAAQCPQIPVLMILNSGQPEVREEIARQCPPHVQIVDRVPFDMMPSVFRGAKLFISTGSQEHEGFPNVLIQAAASRVPILSLDFLPQPFVEMGVGTIAGSVSRLSALMTTLTTNQEAAAAMARAGRQIVEQQFTLAGYTDRLMRALRSTEVT